MNTTTLVTNGCCVECSRQREQLRLAKKRLELQQERLLIDQDMLTEEKNNFQKNVKLSSKKYTQDNGGVSIRNDGERTRLTIVPERDNNSSCNKKNNINSRQHNVEKEFRLHRHREKEEDTLRVTTDTSFIAITASTEIGSRSGNEHTHCCCEGLNLQLLKLKKELGAAIKKHSEEKEKWENKILNFVQSETTTSSTPNNIFVHCSADEEVKRLTELLKTFEKENETLREEKRDLRWSSESSLKSITVDKERECLEWRREKEILEKKIDDLNLLLPRNKVLLEQTQSKNKQLKLQLEEIESHNCKQTVSIIELKQKLETQRQKQQQYDDEQEFQKGMETIISNYDDTLKNSPFLIPSDYSLKDFSALKKKFVFEWEWTMDGHKNGLGGHYTGWLDLEGNPDGYGTLRILDGSIYCGNWTEGVRTGNGVYTSINGALFLGSWLNDRFQGRGVYVSEIDQVYTGDFDNGLKHGSGVETWEGGARYVGNYQHDKRNGKGCYTYPDGRKFNGDYKNNEPDGNGTQTSSDGSVLHEGEWSMGEFVGS